jgi:Tol biopolymer transport system component
MPPALSPPPLEEIRQHMERLLKCARFRNKQKLVAFLRYVVEKKLEGQEDQIKESCIGVEALGYSPGHDPTSAVRVHATRLRRLLAEYYEDEGRDDRVQIELPPGGYVPVFRLREAAAKPAIRSAPGRAWGAAVVLAGAVAGVLTFGPRREIQYSSPGERQITFATSVARQPAVSADGRSLVYSSDEGGDFDIWLRRLNGDPVPVRLTRESSHEVTPDISPDGRWVVYRSMSDGGIYIIPAVGGSVRRLSADGFGPRFSPDGGRIAYAVIEESGNSAVFVSSREGGTSVRMSTGLHNAACPVWSPDGRRLLVLATAPGERDYDWWLIPSEPGAGLPVRTGASSVLHAAGLRAVASGDCASDWDGQAILCGKSGRVVEVLLAGQPGKAQKAIRLRFQGPRSANPRYLGRPARQGRMIVEIGAPGTTIEGHRADVNEGRLKDERKELVQDQSLGYRAGAARVTMSADGRKLAYVSLRSGRWQVWVRNLLTGEESPVPNPGAGVLHPVLNAAGTKLAFSSSQASGTSVWVAVLATGQINRVCADCGTILDWSGDERKLLLAAGRELIELDLATRRRRVLAGGQGYEPFDAEYSPDGEWVVAALGMAAKRDLQGVILPARSAAESEWIPVTEEQYSLTLRWAPSGTLVYFFSRRDGQRCLWARRLNARTKRPVGDAFAVEHFHGGRMRIEGMGWLSVGGDWLAVKVDHATANLWLLERERPFYR